MPRQKGDLNPKKKNRYTDQGSLYPGVMKVRKLRARLMAAQKKGAPEEELERLRLDIKKTKEAGKEASQSS